MGYFVYILACYINGQFSCYYTGQTNNLRARMSEHYNSVRNHDTDHFTGRFGYVKLAWYRKVPSREDALRLEAYLKDLSPHGKESYIQNN